MRKGLDFQSSFSLLFINILTESKFLGKNLITGRPMLEEDELGRLTGKCWVVRRVRPSAGKLARVCVWAEQHPEVVWYWTAMQIKQGVTT